MKMNKEIIKIKKAYSKHSGDWLHWELFNDLMYLHYIILNNIWTGLTKSDPVANEKKARKKEKERLFWPKLGFLPSSFFSLLIIVQLIFSLFVLVIYLSCFLLLLNCYSYFCHNLQTISLFLFNILFVFWMFQRQFDFFKLITLISRSRTSRNHFAC